MKLIDCFLGKTRLVKNFQMLFGGGGREGDWVVNPVTRPVFHG